MASEAPAKFPGSESTDPAARSGPAPTAENPAGVFPKSGTQTAPTPTHHASIASSIENPYALNDALTKLDVALDEIIALFNTERETTASEGSFGKGKEALQMFKSWQAEIEKIRHREE